MVPDPEEPVEFLPVDEPPPRVTRRKVLIAGAGVAALAGIGAFVLSSGKGGGERGGSGAGKPRGKAAPSAARSKEPLPADLQAYVRRKAADGALVAGSRGSSLHHPVLCANHLGGVVASRPRHEGPGRKSGAMSAGMGHARRVRKPKSGEPTLHHDVRDGILYTLLRGERDEQVRTGLAIVAAMAWPYSVRFADLAIAGARESKRGPLSAAKVSAALSAAAPAASARAGEAVRLLEARLVDRKTPKPKKVRKPRKAGGMDSGK